MVSTHGSVVPLAMFTFKNSIFGNTTLEKTQVLILIETPAQELAQNNGCLTSR